MYFTNIFVYNDQMVKQMTSYQAGACNSFVGLSVLLVCCIC